MMAIPSPENLSRARRILNSMNGLLLMAVKHVPQAKIDKTLHGWLHGAPWLDKGPPSPEVMQSVLQLVLDSSVFVPSLSGSTAIDRLARRHTPRSPEELAALTHLRRFRFRLLKLESPLPGGGFVVGDAVNGEPAKLIDHADSPFDVGTTIAAHICSIEGDLLAAVGPIVLVDEALFDIARTYIRPGRKDLINPHRCADAMFRRMVHRGSLIGPAITSRSKGTRHATFPFFPEDGPLHRLAFDLSRRNADTQPSPRQIQAIRGEISTDAIAKATVAIAVAREIGKAPLASAYEIILDVLLDTAERRVLSGMAGWSEALDKLDRDVRAAADSGEVPSTAHRIFEVARSRARMKFSARPDTASKANLDKVLGRIQALREKTVDKGCTEEEALAAAEKVAELLDRYGLSLSEIELKDQTCEGFGVDTGRKRAGPIDSCIPSVATFCDCRVWIETQPDDTLRYLFFGLPADVAGARYLYEMVARAFETETQRFQRGETYTRHDSGGRRTATRSFQFGLAHGIAGKLQRLHDEREAAMTASTGRDLVPIKAAVVDEELDKLGLLLTNRTNKRPRVLGDAYHAGREAGDRFEYRPALEEE